MWDNEVALQKLTTENEELKKSTTKLKAQLIRHETVMKQNSEVIETLKSKEEALLTKLSDMKTRQDFASQEAVRQVAALSKENKELLEKIEFLQHPTSPNSDTLVYLARKRSIQSLLNNGDDQANSQSTSLPGDLSLDIEDAHMVDFLTFLPPISPDQSLTFSSEALMASVNSAREEIHMLTSEIATHKSHNQELETLLRQHEETIQQLTASLTDEGKRVKEREHVQVQTEPSSNPVSVVTELPILKSVHSQGSEITLLDEKSVQSRQEKKQPSHTNEANLVDVCKQAAWSQDTLLQARAAIDAMLENASSPKFSTAQKRLSGEALATSKPIPGIDVRLGSPSPRSSIQRSQSAELPSPVEKNRPSLESLPKYVKIPTLNINGSSDNQELVYEWVPLDYLRTVARYSLPGKDKAKPGLRRMLSVKDKEKGQSRLSVIPNVFEFDGTFAEDTEQEETQPETTTSVQKEQQECMSLVTRPLNLTPDATILSISQAMIGCWFFKYTRYHRRPHLRFFWLHPYTKMLYWSERESVVLGTLEKLQGPEDHTTQRLSTQPAADEAVKKESEVANQTVSKKLRAAFVHGVEEVLLDCEHAVYSNSADNDMFHIAIVVHSSGRSVKLVAANQEQHDVWLKVNFLFKHLFVFETNMFNPQALRFVVNRPCTQLDLNTTSNLAMLRWPLLENTLELSSFV
jgi:predicted  nucleic acid-binding Zn-ribbon protein